MLVGDNFLVSGGSPCADCCLVGNSITLRRHHDPGNSYKRKRHLIGAGLLVKRFSPSLPWGEAWQHTGSHRAGEGAESSDTNQQAAGRESDLELL